MDQYTIFTVVLEGVALVIAAWALRTSFQLSAVRAQSPQWAVFFDLCRGLAVAWTGIAAICMVEVILPGVWSRMVGGSIVPQMFWLCVSAGTLVFLSGRRAEFRGMHLFQQTDEVHARLKATQDALRDTEERFRLFMDNLPGVAWISDEQGVFLYVCQRYGDFWGRQPSEYIGRRYDEMFPASSAATWMRNQRRVFTHREVILSIEESPEVGAYPARRWLVNCFPLPHNGSVLLGGIGVDITHVCTARDCPLTQQRGVIAPAAKGGRAKHV